MASEKKQKVVVIMGPTGSGKSKLAIDLASHFPIEVINADSMQVYRGLDVLTNKLSSLEQKGVRHHLLGTVNPKVEFTSKDFRDSAIPIIEEIFCRNNLPVIVGGTSYYIQALISPFLLDETTDDIDDASSSGEAEPSCNEETCDCYDRLASIDPVAANRIHPNNHRKIIQYLSLYARSGTLPSELLQGNAAQNWGRVDNLRYDCCFICMEVSLPVIDCYVNQRVDCMVDSGLLNEVCDIFSLNADYTRGLLQAIGVREFESFLGSEEEEGARAAMLREAIEKVKLNTRRLVRRQRRMAVRLQNLFGWNIHFVDATESISSESDVIWAEEVVEPAAEIVRAFLDRDSNNTPNCNGTRISERELWTQFTCEACSNKVLRGANEWEQHKQGRSHRKRISKLRKRSLEYLSTKYSQD